MSATSVRPGGIKTNIARDARFDDSASSITGQSSEASKKSFEKLFRTTADEAAATILDGVERDARRVLIGVDAKAIDLVQRALPTAYQSILGSLAKLQKKAKK